jgi:hypothetical protein
MGKELQTVPQTTYIKLLKDIEKRKYELEAEYKQMEKQRKDLQDQANSAVNRLRSYSIIY